jgi:hypothetical protein
MAALDLLHGLKENASSCITAAAISQQMLYSTINPIELGFLEGWWFSWYSYFNNPVLATGIMSFLMHEVSFRAGSGAARLLIPLLSSCTSADAFPGSQSMPCPTSGAGNYSL